MAKTQEITKIDEAKQKIAEWTGEDPVEFYDHLWQIVNEGLKSEQTEAQERVSKIDDSFRELRLSLPSVVSEEEETVEAPSGGGGSGRSERRNAFTYYSGTLEILRQAGDKALTKREIAERFKTVLHYESHGKDEKSFENSLYVGGINKLKGEKLVQHVALENQRAGGYTLTPAGRRAAEKRMSA